MKRFLEIVQRVGQKPSYDPSVCLLKELRLVERAGKIDTGINFAKAEARRD